MSTYTITTVTVTPTDHGYEWDIFGARKSVTTAGNITNTIGLRAAMDKAGLDHYDAEPETTPAVKVMCQPVGRHVSGGKAVGSRYHTAAELADMSATRRRVIESLQRSLPIGAES